MATSSTLNLNQPVQGLWVKTSTKDTEPDAKARAQLQERKIARLQKMAKDLDGEIQKTREESYNLGFEDGLAAEKEKHEQALEAHARQVQDLAQRLETGVGQALELMEEPLLRMSFNIAEKILRAPLPDELRTQSIKTSLSTFLKEVLHATSVTVYVAPADMEIFQAPDVGEQLDYPTPEKLRFVADAKLVPGECSVETPEHVIDGRYDIQLAKLAKDLA